MAKIYSESIVITFSKLVKDDVIPEPIPTPDIISSLVSVAEELAGPGVVIEIERA